MTQHGRDQLHANWPEFYKPDQEATLPAEELLLLKKGGDYGWPECYYDPFVQKLVLSPGYGGDGQKIGVCTNKITPGPMPPMGGAQLTPDQVNAVAAYVWSVSHRATSK